MSTWKSHLIATLGFGASAALLGACGNDVAISAETTATSNTSSTSSSGSMSSSSGTTMGTGGASTSSSSSSSSSSSTGGPPPAQRVVTAETDIAQYQSITVSTTSTESGAKVIDGPFFVTDVAGGWQQGPGGASFHVVTNGDCSVAVGMTVLSTNVGQNAAYQVHGIRMPVLPGQTLCMSGALTTAIVMGFKPY